MSAAAALSLHWAASSSPPTSSELLSLGAVSFCACSLNSVSRRSRDMFLDRYLLQRQHGVAAQVTG